MELNNCQQTKSRLAPFIKAPGICCNVVFHHAADKYANKLLESPAIIQGVNEDGTVNLVFFHVNGSIFFRLSVSQGKKANEWDWPDELV
jgi:hypothetical protein